MSKGWKMRVLGLDYGDRRIGVAICDELGMTARGIATVVRKNRDADLAAIAGFVERFGVEKIVIGYPLRLDGSEGIQRLEPIKKAAYTIKCHWDGILRWFTSKINNGILEGINSLIQAVKAKAKEYRTTKNLITMIYLIGGKLEFRLPT